MADSWPKALHLPFVNLLWQPIILTIKYFDFQTIYLLQNIPKTQKCQYIFSIFFILILCLEMVSEDF